MDKLNRIRDHYWWLQLTGKHYGVESMKGVPTLTSERTTQAPMKGLTDATTTRITLTHHTQRYQDARMT